MKNPFTKKELKPISELANIIKGSTEQEQKAAPVEVPNQIELLKSDIKSLKTENAALKSAMAEIAQPSTNSIAKIRAIAERLSDELNCV